MSFLRKPPNKTLSLLTATLRRFTTQNPAAAAAAVKPFPDDPTSAYYDELASAAGHSGDLDALRHLLNKRIQDGCFNTKRTFSFITNTTTTPLDDVVRTLSHLNAGITRKSAFDSLITRLCKLHRVDDALRVVDAMARGDCSLNACTFYPILNLLTRKENTMEEAWRVVDLMARLGVRLDLTVHNFFLMAYCAAGDLSAAAGVLRKMEAEEGMAADARTFDARTFDARTFDARTFDALVFGACRAGFVEGAMVLLRRMVDDGVPALYSTHVYVIGALLEMQCYELAVRYVRGVGGRDLVCDAEIFGCLASKLVKLKKIEVALLVLEEMKHRGLSMGCKLEKFYEMNVGGNKI